MRLPEAFVADRDARAFELRKSGMSYRAIGRALDISESTAHTAVQRQMERIGRRLAEQHKDAFLLDMQRLDSLLFNLWPMTMPYKSTTDDGDVIELPPNFDAIDRAIKIIDRRAKMMGFDTLQVQLGPSAEGPSLEAKEKLTEVTPQDEALKLWKIMRDSGVIDPKEVQRLLGGDEDILDAEIIEDEPLELESGEGDENSSPDP